VVLETETPQGKLAFANTAEQFDASDGGSCAIKVFVAEHRPSCAPGMFNSLGVQVLYPT
jgi:hypothetical protein